MHQKGPLGTASRGRKTTQEVERAPAFHACLQCREVMIDTMARPYAYSAWL